jgi:hypothetical protein
LSVALFERVGVITLIGKLAEQFAIGIGQEFVLIERKGDGVLFDPSSLPFYLIVAVLAWGDLHLLQIVPEFVIRYDERVTLPSILDTVRVIVVLGGRLDHGARLSQFVKCLD